MKGFLSFIQFVSDHRQIIMPGFLAMLLWLTVRQMFAAVRDALDDGDRRF